MTPMNPESVRELIALVESTTAAAKAAEARAEEAKARAMLALEERTWRLCVCEFLATRKEPRRRAW